MSIRVTFIAFFIFFFATPLFAQDRYFYFGQSILFPIDLEPDSGRGDETYGIDIGYFLTERWWGTLGVETGLRDAKRVALSFGARGYFRLYSSLKPVVSL